MFAGWLSRVLGAEVWGSGLGRAAASCFDRGLWSLAQGKPGIRLLPGGAGARSCLVLAPCSGFSAASFNNCIYRYIHIYADRSISSRRALCLYMGISRVWSELL